MNRDFYFKGFKFAIAGSLGVLTGLSIQFVFTSIFHFHYLIGAIIGYACGFMVNYTSNILNGNIKIEKRIER